MKINEAVRELRTRLGDTQQSFAHRMGWAISTVARYESSRPPTGKALVVLVYLAGRNDHLDLADVFWDEFKREMGIEPRES